MSSNVRRVTFAEGVTLISLGFLLEDRVRACPAIGSGGAALGAEMKRDSITS